MSTKTVNELEQLANEGDYGAAYELGKMYLVGEEVAVDYGKAKWYLEAAACNGVVGANYYLGKIYYNGNGVQTDHAKAKEYFEKAAKANNMFSNYFLGKIYYWGDGVEKDIEKAGQYKKAILNQPLYINQDTDIENFYSIPDFEDVTKKYVKDIQTSVQNEFQKLFGEDC